MKPDQPVLAHDVLGIFNRDDEIVVRFNLPGRSALEARIHPDDVQAFDQMRRSTEGEIDISMLWGWEVAE